MKFKLLSAALILSLFLAACIKDDDDTVTTPPPPPPTPAPCPPCPVPTYPVAGIWVGTYTITQLPSVSPIPYTFSFSPDGTLFTHGKGDDGNVYFAKGTWTVSADSVVTANYTTLNYGAYQVTQEARLRYHKDGTMSTATWEDKVNPAGYLSGTFQNLKRVN